MEYESLIGFIFSRIISALTDQILEKSTESTKLKIEYNYFTQYFNEFKLDRFLANLCSQVNENKISEKR